MDAVKKDELTALLRELSCKILQKDELISFCRKVQTLYVNDRRHVYSDIFAVLIALFKEDDSTLDTLSINMSCLKTLFEGRYKEDPAKEEKHGVYKNWVKFYDHAMLEIYRIKEWSTRHLEDQRALDEKLEDSTKILKDLETKAKYMESHYITILGIFAAIIMGANSVIAISSTVLSTIAASSPINLCIGGIVYLLLTLNIIFALAWTITRETLDDRRKLWLCWFLGIMNSLLIIGMIVLAMLSFNSAEAMPKEEEQLEPYCFVECNLYNRRIAL